MAALSGAAIRRSSSQDRQGQFVSTLPGILAGLAALVTAAGTVVGVLWGTGALQGGGSVAQRHGVVITLPSRPPEGLAINGQLSVAKRGIPELRVAGNVRRLWATFTLAILPRSGKVTVLWFAPSRKLVGRVDTPASKSVVTALESTPQEPLETGTWHAQLVSAGLVIKDARLTIGSQARTDHAATAPPPLPIHYPRRQVIP